MHTAGGGGAPGRDPAVAVEPASPAHRDWLLNLDRNSIPPAVTARLIRDRHITRDTFRPLDRLPRLTDPAGHTFFLLPRGSTGAELRRATLAAYLFNAGTGYAAAGRRAGVCNDFLDTAYSAAEAARIAARQRRNAWSYPATAALINAGGCVAATPAGILIAIAGTALHRGLGRRGGTMWGETFVVNTGRGVDPAHRLAAIVAAGRLHRGGPDLARVLHHEERHARQWARYGLLMGARYIAEEVRARLLGTANVFEAAAGLGDGGYR